MSSINKFSALEKEVYWEVDGFHPPPVASLRGRGLPAFLLNETVLRNILGLPLVLFLPGYALIATFFP